MLIVLGRRGFQRNLDYYDSSTGDEGGHCVVLVGRLESKSPTYPGFAQRSGIRNAFPHVKNSLGARFHRYR